MTSLQGTAAEFAFLGGRVATMDPAHPFTDGAAVRRGTIATTGAAAVRELIGPRTRVIDLRGKLLLPGFFDAHAHPVYAGVQQLRCDLSGCATPEDYVRRVAAHCADHPERGWVRGGGWDPGHFPDGTPTAAQLDRATGARPAFLLSSDHHAAWVNTAALRAAGVDRQVSVPPDGMLARDAAGEPLGTLQEGATRLVEGVLPTDDEHEYLRGLLLAQQQLHRVGVVGWHDAIVGPYLGYRDTLDTYRRADREDMLTAKVRGALWWDRSAGTGQIDDLLERRERSRGRNFRADAVKIMQDGVCESHTAALITSYRDMNSTGMSFVDAAALRDVVSALDGSGFQVHFHAVGDRAVREALDAIEAARRSGPDRDLRHQIAHVQVLDPADVHRFAELGATATVQPQWAVNDPAMTELTIPRLGEDRSSFQYPFRSLHREGAALAIGSDWPVSPADPMRSVHAAVNRREGTSDPALNPEQALDLHTALAACTRGAARVNHLDDRTGMVRPGFAADLVLLDHDPFALPAAEIGRCQVELTLSDGDIRYELEA